MELRGFGCANEGCGTEEFLVWNRGVLGVELRGVELRSFWCVTKEFSM